ncbi:hypothetical protein SAMN05421833_129100 [Microbispora rosea]|uniref:3-methyladenine DNA glycosylase AlkD n=1 Tax=Microbispora rosea TaxID=58117 RepID=A0A1N7GJI0_9ACTN|nr:DUF6000 family protein [Microbispora rosea]GIH51692.1 hypothetical protein Mro03_68710 [Microbispora rosea subsp. rosea]SIS12672.1 hypothetical protein SAMN05421833_129100 [Microbispora rosea]
MSTSPDDDPEITSADTRPTLADVVQRYVVWDRDEPRYLKLLGGKLPKLSNRFKAALADDARHISDEDLHELLRCDWRPRLTAAWLIGIDRRVRFRQAIGELLLSSEVCYAGQGYCFALATFGQSHDAEILTAYLDRYLPRTDCYYDQHWAIGALLHLDDRLGTHHSDQYLTTGLWQASAFSRLDPADYQHTIDELCNTTRVLTNAAGRDSLSPGNPGP